jgi:hypothetical protein
LSTGRGIDKAEESLHIVREHREGQRDEGDDKKRLKVNE